MKKAHLLQSHSGLDGIPGIPTQFALNRLSDNLDLERLFDPAIHAERDWELAP
jgi:hypothetical protein